MLSLYRHCRTFGCFLEMSHSVGFPKAPTNIPLSVQQELYKEIIRISMKVLGRYGAYV